MMLAEVIDLPATKLASLVGCTPRKIRRMRTGQLPVDNVEIDDEAIFKIKESLAKDEEGKTLRENVYAVETDLLQVLVAADMQATRGVSEELLREHDKEIQELLKERHDVLLLASKAKITKTWNPKEKTTEELLARHKKRMIDLEDSKEKPSERMLREVNARLKRET